VRSPRDRAGSDHIRDQPRGIYSGTRLTMPS